MAESVVLALDVGTSGVKAVACDAAGRPSMSRQRNYGLNTPSAGWVEQDLDEIMAASVGVLRDLVDGGVEPGSVAAIGVTAQMFNIVAADERGRPLAPMLSWLDQRAAPQAAAFARECPPDEQYRRFGAVITAKDILPRIFWLREAWPEVWQKTTFLLDCKEAVVAALTGAVVTDAAGASAFRLLDPTSRDWDPARAESAGVPIDRLPPVRRATDLAGRLRDEIAHLTGLPAGTPVAVGAGDVAASQVGSGAVEVGDVHLSLGTAVYFGITVDRPVPDPSRRLGVIGHADPAHWILWLEIATGGAALAWLMRTLEGSAVEHSDLDEMVEAAAADMDGLMFAPWLSGERVPLFDDRLRGAFVGLSLRHRRGHLIRAVMEGVACQIRWAWEYGLAFGIPVGTIRAVGGGGIGRAWTSIIADTIGLPLEVVADAPIAGARGAAACALVGSGLAPDLATVARTTRVARTVEPDPQRRSRGDERFDRFQRLHAALAPLFAGG